MSKIYKKLTLAEVQALSAGENIFITQRACVHSINALVRTTTDDSILPVVVVDGSEIRTMSLKYHTYGTEWYAEQLSLVKLNIPGLTAYHIGANDEDLSVKMDIHATNENEAKRIAVKGEDAINHILFAESSPDPLAKAIGAMIQTKAITFYTTGGWNGEKDVFLHSTVFTDTDLSFGIDEDEWNASPSEAVAAFLADQVRKGKITFITAIDN